MPESLSNTVCVIFNVFQKSLVRLFWRRFKSDFKKRWSEPSCHAGTPEALFKHVSPVHET